MKSWRKFNKDMLLKNRQFLSITGLLYLIAFLLGVINVPAGNFSGTAWLFVLLGIFIWGDALILGPFMIIACIWLYFKNKRVLTGLFFSIFLAVRAFFEIAYALNAQFSGSIRPWEIEWRESKLIQSVGINETFVLYQLVFTIIFVVSSLTFVYFLKRYLHG